MSRAGNNLGPVGLSVLLHVAIFASMIVAIDYTRPTPFTPLAIQATLLDDGLGLGFSLGRAEDRRVDAYRPP